MYLNDDLFASSEAYPESVDNQLRVTQPNIMFTTSHTSTNSSGLFSFQRTLNPSCPEDPFDQNYQPFVFKGSSELPSPTDPPFPNSLEQGQKLIDLEKDEDKKNLRLERQTDYFNWNDISTSQQINSSSSSISERNQVNSNINMKMQPTVPQNTNFLMMYFRVTHSDPRTFNQNLPMSYNVEQNQFCPNFFPDFLQTRAESLQNINSNGIEYSGLISTRDSTNPQSSSGNYNEYSDDEEKEYSDDKKEINTFKIKKKALLSSSSRQR